MADTVKDDLEELRWKRLEAKFQELREAVIELMEEEAADRCTQIA